MSESGDETKRAAVKGSAPPRRGERAGAGGALAVVAEGSTHGGAGENGERETKSGRGHGKEEMKRAADRRAYRSWDANRGAGSLLFSTPMDDAIIAEPAEGAENEAGRAETGEDGLDEIQADKGRDEQPPRIDEVGEGDADEGDGAGEETDEGVDFHGEERLVLYLICAYTHIVETMSSPCSLASMAKKIPLNDEALEHVSRRFAVLAEPMRLRLLQALFDGEKNVNTLVDETGGTQANVSRHLQTLTQAHILSRRKEGLQVFYAIADPSIFKLCELVCGSLEKQFTKNADSFSR